MNLFGFRAAVPEPLPTPAVEGIPPVPRDYTFTAAEADLLQAINQLWRKYLALTDADRLSRQSPQTYDQRQDVRQALTRVQDAILARLARRAHPQDFS